MSNTLFNGRAGRIVGWLAAHPNGLRFGELLALEKAARPETTVQQFSATLGQLVNRKRVSRNGKPHHYLYRLASGTPKKAVKKAARKSAESKPAHEPRTKQYASPLARPPKKDSQPTLVRKGSAARLRPRIASADARPETVEEFLARGGRIQYCAHGERGGGPTSYREQSQAHKDRMRAEIIARHKAKARNQLDLDADDDLDDAA